MESHFNVSGYLMVVVGVLKISKIKNLKYMAILFKFKIFKNSFIF